MGYAMLRRHKQKEVVKEEQQLSEQLKEKRIEEFLKENCVKHKLSWGYLRGKRRDNTLPAGQCAQSSPTRRNGLPRRCAPRNDRGRNVTERYNRVGQATGSVTNTTPAARRRASQ